MHYYDENGAAGYVSGSPGYLKKLRHTGGGPKFRKVGRKVIYEEPDLDAWIASHPKVASTSETAARVAALAAGEGDR